MVILGDAGAVGDEQVLDGRGDGGTGAAGLGDGGGAVEREQAGGGGVGDDQARHRDGEDARGGRVEVAEHGAVPGLADGDDVVGCAADGDAFLAGEEQLGAVGGRVGAVRGWGLDEDVLRVGAGGGEGPGEGAVVADDEERDAGGEGAGQGVAGGVDAGEIPDGGEGQAEMRVAGEERGAGGAVGAVDGPFVAGLVG